MSSFLAVSSHALITATAAHPISEHPEWELGISAN
jgi:hypothetical protein